jgi:3-deoxy-D-manno-octulosonate 8-phosphate phosphatase (KDO 8-P phosphatase)
MSCDNALLARHERDLVERLAALRLVVFDVDGVLTDGRIILGDDGDEYKAFHTHDGHGIRMLRQSGVEVGIVTGRTSALVNRRAEELGIALLMQGRKDKVDALNEMADRLGLAPHVLAFVGDDIVDADAMDHAGVGVAVANATIRAREQADLVTERDGGYGAAREVCELIVAAQGPSSLGGPSADR